MSVWPVKRSGFGAIAVVISALVIGSWQASALGDEPSSDHEVLKLWPGGTPGAKGTDPDKDVPTLTVWLPKPEMATGSAVVICPGGGYGMLAVDHEGKQVAEWLNSLGVAAFVLKYRLGPRYHHPAMLQDAGRAIRTVRAGGQEVGRRSRTGSRSSASPPGATWPRRPATHFDAGKPDAEDPIERVSSPSRQGDPRLSGGRPGDALRPFRVEAEPAGRQPVRGTGAVPLQRDPGDRGDAADVPRPHQCRHRSPGREQPALRDGPAQGQGPRRASPLREGPARTWAWGAARSSSASRPTRPSGSGRSCARSGSRGRGSSIAHRIRRARLTGADQRAARTNSSLDVLGLASR